MSGKWPGRDFFSYANRGGGGGGKIKALIPLHFPLLKPAKIKFLQIPSPGYSSGYIRAKTEGPIFAQLLVAKKSRYKGNIERGENKRGDK